MNTVTRAKRRGRRPSSRKIRRGLLLGILMALPIVSGAELLHLYNISVDAPVAPEATGALDNVVPLATGFTMQADKGTVGRDIVDWLNGNETGSRLFDVGGHQFLGDTDVLTEESRGRVARLAMMLRANKDVSVTIIGYFNPGGTPSPGDRMPERRAESVNDALVADGIAAQRLTIEVRASTEPVTPAHRVAILLNRENRGQES
jgi:outer membrane protein OmpA-like peptidoglycan-associated protein